jgi:phosphonate transport system substrate-binding protein
MLTFTSCMAPNMEPMCRAVVAHLAATLGEPTHFVGDIPWREREREFDAGRIDVVWICGLPYVWKARHPSRAVRLLAAPVMQGERYGGRPIYYSDVVVRRRSPYRSFEDLRGARFAYNEPRSHSGYNVVRHHLAALGARGGYFATAAESGAHQVSLRWIVEDRVDASVIDSTVLELELQRDPTLAEHVTVIGTLGPSPMPPWLVRADLPHARYARLQTALLELHESAAGRSILAGCGIERFAPVADEDYDPIREMSAQARGVRLEAGDPTGAGP